MIQLRRVAYFSSVPLVNRSLITWSHFCSQGKDEYIGKTSCFPTVRLSLDKPAPCLEWYSIIRYGKYAGELLAAFELLLVSRIMIWIRRVNIMLYVHYVSSFRMRAGLFLLTHPLPQPQTLTSRYPLVSDRSRRRPELKYIILHHTHTYICVHV